MLYPNFPFHITHHDTPIRCSTKATGWPSYLNLCLTLSLTLHDRPRPEYFCLGPGEAPDTTPWNRSTMAHNDEATNRAVHDVWSQASPD